MIPEICAMKHGQIYDYHQCLAVYVPIIIWNVDVIEYSAWLIIIRVWVSIFFFIIIFLSNRFLIGFFFHCFLPLRIYFRFIKFLTKRKQSEGKMQTENNIKLLEKREKKIFLLFLPLDKILWKQVYFNASFPIEYIFPKNRITKIIAALFHCSASMCWYR